jgi:hypothetical protein
VRELGLAGGFLFAWSDEWFKFTWNTIAHQQPADRRQLWHDPLTNEQHFGVMATDPQGSPDAVDQVLVDDPEARPAQAVVADVDESYVHLRLRLAAPVQDRLTIGLDVLPRLTGPPPPGSTDQRADAAFVLDLAGRTGQAWLRTQLDPLPLDFAIPPEARPAPVTGWQRFQLIVNRSPTVPTTGKRYPIEFFEAGALRHGPWEPGERDADSRALWLLNGTDLTVRVPWGMAGFADPSGHRVLVPRGATPTVETTPGIDVTVSTAGTTQVAGQVRWAGWNRTYHQERIKRGARVLRDAYVETGR